MLQKILTKQVVVYNVAHMYTTMLHKILIKQAQVQLSHHFHTICGCNGVIHHHYSHFADARGLMDGLHIASNGLHCLWGLHNDGPLQKIMM